LKFDRRKKKLYKAHFAHYTHATRRKSRFINFSSDETPMTSVRPWLLTFDV